MAIKAVRKDGNTYEYGIILSKREIFWAGYKMGSFKQQPDYVIYAPIYIQEMLHAGSWKEIE
jgi:hypothetical protein